MTEEMKAWQKIAMKNASAYGILIGQLKGIIDSYLIEKRFETAPSADTLIEKLQKIVLDAEEGGKS